MNKKVILPKRRKTWSEMNCAEKRVSLCKDVIKQVEAGFLTVKTGVYVRIKKTLKYKLNYDEQANKQICNIPNACSVCAKGALFVTDVIKRNNLLASDFMYADRNEDMVKRLRSFFGEKRLHNIESAFEGRCLYGDYNEKAIEFYKKHRGNAGERLIAIMKNIIKNEGEFTL